jgi:hypothetical protein
MNIHDLINLVTWLHIHDLAISPVSYNWMAASLLPHFNTFVAVMQTKCYMRCFNVPPTVKHSVDGA